MGSSTIASESAVETSSTQCCSTVSSSTSTVTSSSNRTSEEEREPEQQASTKIIGSGGPLRLPRLSAVTRSVPYNLQPATVAAAEASSSVGASRVEENTCHCQQQKHLPESVTAPVLGSVVEDLGAASRLGAPPPVVQPVPVAIAAAPASAPPTPMLFIPISVSSFVPPMTGAIIQKANSYNSGGAATSTLKVLLFSSQ